MNTPRGWAEIEAGIEREPETGIVRGSSVRFYSGNVIGQVVHVAKHGETVRVRWPNGTETVERVTSLQVVVR